MKKKIAFLSLALLVLTLAFALTACGGGTTGGGVDPEGCQHQWDETIEQEATCTASGRKMLICKLCGDARKEEINPLGHDVVVIQGKAATCTEEGLTDGKSCNRCQSVLEEQSVISVLPHTPVTDAAVAESCTTNGLTEGSHCEVCETVITEQTVVNALGHSWSYVAAVAPTCTETGLTEGKECTVCHYIEKAQTVVAANGHREVTDVGYAATCLTAGLSDGKHCSVCYETLVAQEPIAATGHKIKSRGDLAPTCEATGHVGEKYCENCKKVFEEEFILEKVDHNFVNGTCTYCTLTFSAGLVYADVDSDSCEVTDIGSCDDEIIVIPEVHENKDVVGIADGAFEGTDIKEVVIIGELEYIGEDAFKDCTALKSVTLPKSVTEVKSGAFDGASSLETIKCEDFAQTNGWASDYLGSASATVSAEKNNGLTPYEIYLLAMENINSNLDKYVADDHRVLTMDEVPGADAQTQFFLSMLQMDIRNHIEYCGDQFYIRTTTKSKDYQYDSQGYPVYGPNNMPVMIDVTVTNQYWYYDGVFWAIEPDAYPSEKTVIRIGTLALQEVLKMSAGGSESYVFSEKFFKAAEFTKNGSGYRLSVDVSGDALTEFLLAMSSDSMGDTFEELGFAYDDVTYYYYFDANGKIESVYVDAGFSFGADSGMPGLTGNVVITQTFSSVGTLSEISTKPIGNGFTSNDVPPVGNCQHPTYSRTTVKGFAASCTEAGLSDGVYCKSCWQDITLPTVIAAKGHKVTNGVCTVCSEDVIEGSQGLAYSYSTDGKTATLIGVGSCSDEKIVIPSSIYGVVVNKIAKDAFRGSSVTEIVVPSSVTAVEAGAFDGASNLKKISISADLAGSLPNTITEVVITGGETIKAGSFVNFKNLTTITVPSSITLIEDGAFVGCDRLVIIYDFSYLDIEAGDEQNNGGIGKYAMSVITRIDVEPNIYVEGDFVFKKQSNSYYLAKYLGNAENLVLPANFKGNVYSIAANAFNGVSTIKTISAPAGIKAGYGAFDGCTSAITEAIGDASFIVYVPTEKLQRVEIISGSMGQAYLENSPELKTVIISNASFSYGRAFRNCPKLESVVIGEGVSSISGYSFVNCVAMKEFVIGDDVTEIGQGVLDGSGKVDLYISDIAAWCGINFDYWSYSDGYANVWKNVANLYVRGVKTTELVIPDTVETISPYAFAYCEAVNSFELPEGLEYIGDCAFLESSIDAIELPEGLIEIGVSAFENTDLVYIYVPDSVSVIEEKAFRGCAALASVDIDGVIEIGNSAFSKCSSLEFVSLGNELVSIGDNAFASTALRFISFPETLESIGSEAFYNTPLVSVTLPESLVSIGYDAFRDCYRIVELINKSNVEASELDDSAITDFADLIVTSGESIIDYDENGFGFIEIGGVTYLVDWYSDSKHLTLPESYKGGLYTVAPYTFYKSKLVSVDMSRGVYEIKENAFADSLRLLSVTLGDSVEEITSTAFNGCELLIEIVANSDKGLVNWDFSEGESKIIYEGDFAFYTKKDGITYLIAYIGDSSTVILPEYCGGNPYAVNSYALYYADITSIEIPDTILTFGEHFIDDEKIENTVYNDIRYIGNSENPYLIALGPVLDHNDMNTDLENIILHDDTVYIAPWAFYNQTRVKSIYFGKSLKVICEVAFMFLDGDDIDITLPATVERIDSEAFDRAENIKKVILPESLKYIGEDAFYWSSIVEVNIPENVEFIGANAFTNCLKLSKIYYNPKNLQEEAIGDDAFNINYFSEPSAERTIIYGDGIVRIPDALAVGNVVKTVMNDFSCLTYIGSYGLSYYAGDATELYLPNVTYVGYGAFLGSTALKSVVFSDALEEIEDNAFRLCTSLERAELGNDTVIGEEIFFGCTSLKSVRLPLESIYLRDLFEDYYGNGGVPATLKKVEVIGESVGSYVLSECTGVEEIIIGANVTKINVQAFSACTNLASVDFEIETGWSMGSDPVDVSDTGKNAQFLKNGPAYTRTVE